MDHETEAASCGERLTVRCDYCGEEHLADNPLRPSCDECEAAMREAAKDLVLIPGDDPDTDRMADYFGEGAR